MELSSANVEEIFSDCLFEAGEDTSKRILAEGIIRKVNFHPQRLEAHKNDIISMLHQLPDNFHQDKGGGWTFLNACLNNNGEQWTGLHYTMEQLVLLGIAIDKVAFPFPKDMWSALPGGVPYFVVKS